MGVEEPLLVELLREKRRILIFTGAGISTGSGIPDYRGPGGVWSRRQPVYYQDFLASEESRVEYWDSKLEAWEQFRDARPNATHDAIARLEASGRVLKVVTQNIDGLHSLAGTSPERLIELHGTNSLVECQSCGERTDPARSFEKFRETRTPPRCHCNGLLKPATISFGQSLRSEDLDAAFAAASECDMAVSLGSTLSVEPAASVPLSAARRGMPYIVVNRGETAHDELPELSLRLEGDVADLFAGAVVAALR
jgi:NAD-dependent deacetylase